MNKLFASIGEPGHDWEEVGHELLGDDFFCSCQHYGWEFAEGIQEDFRGSPSDLVYVPRFRLYE